MKPGNDIKYLTNDKQDSLAAPPTAEKRLYQRLLVASTLTRCLNTKKMRQNNSHPDQDQHNTPDHLHTLSKFPA